jgi:hypothetical protein
MDGSIRLIPSERKTLLEHYRKSTDPEVRLRAHILLLLPGQTLVVCERPCYPVLVQRQHGRRSIRPPRP